MSDIGKVIGGYRIQRDFCTVGGGMCRWSFATRSGKEYFIKEFLAPKYPIEGSPGSTKTKERRLKACQLFENHQQRLSNAIKSATSSGGNLIAPVDFFRQGSLYYKITEKVDVATLDPSAICRLPIEKKILLLKTITHSLGILHRLGIVHGDLKPENILIKSKGSGDFVAKLIDMDNSYFSGNVPIISDDSDVVGTPNYYSPELGIYVKTRVESAPEKLTVASDIFALGVIFFQYMTGRWPGVPSKYYYVWEAVCDDCVPDLADPGISRSLGLIIAGMLARNSSERPSCSMVFDELKKLGVLGTAALLGSSRLKGTMFKS